MGMDYVSHSAPAIIYAQEALYAARGHAYRTYAYRTYAYRT